MKKVIHNTKYKHKLDIRQFANNYTIDYQYLRSPEEILRDTYKYNVAISLSFCLCEIYCLPITVYISNN